MVCSGWLLHLDILQCTKVPTPQRLTWSSSVKGGIPTRISTSTGFPSLSAGLKTQRLNAIRAASSISGKTPWCTTKCWIVPSIAMIPRRIIVRCELSSGNGRRLKSKRRVRSTSGGTRGFSRCRTVPGVSAVLF